MARNPGDRRDKKHRVLRRGESIRADGKYQFKYLGDGKPHFLYSWRLEPTDKMPAGNKKASLSLRELEKQVRRSLECQTDPSRGNITVRELVERYIQTKTGVRPTTKAGYRTVQKTLKKTGFSSRKIADIKISDAKLYLIQLQKTYSYSSIHTIRGVLRPAFQMAVDDDILVKNPFDFQLFTVVINDSKTREALTRDQMRNFLKFIHDDTYFCRYYEAVYILFHTGMRISEFCGLTVGDIDLHRRIVNIDHQLQRTSKMQLYIEKTKTNAGTRKIPITEDVADCFASILEDRPHPQKEYAIDGYSEFLFLDTQGLPLVASHWQHRFKQMVAKYNRIYRIQMPKITPHVCRHTYCSNMAKSGMNPKTLQYLMGHSDIGVTLNTYTHLGLDDATKELNEMEQRVIDDVQQVKTTPHMFKVIG